MSVRGLVRGLYWSGLDVVGANALARILPDRGAVLCFHNVIADAFQNDERGLHMPVQMFAWMMGWASERLRIVPLAELAQRVRHGRTVRGLASITFDDAYRGVLRNGLPVLAKLGLPATIFAPTQGIDSGRTFWWDWPGLAEAASDPSLREQLLVQCKGDADLVSERLRIKPVELRDEYLPATWDELADVQGPLVEIGSHSVTHRALTSLDDSELAWELLESQRQLGERLGVVPTLFAYPYGLVDARAAAAAADAGYAAAFALGGARLSARSPSHMLPRINVPGTIGRAAFRGWLSGFAPRD